LDNDEEYVEDIHAMGKIEDILCTTYERKYRGIGSDIEEGYPFQIRISVEPTTPCVTKTSEEEKLVNQQVISGRIIFTGHGSSRRSESSTSSSQVSTPRGGGSLENFTIVGEDPTIRLPEFQGDKSDDPEKHLFICEEIWVEKKIIDEDRKVAQLEITFRESVLDSYMGLVTNNPMGTPTTVAEVKRQLINEFQKPSSEDQFMNEMIEIKQKIGESVWEVDQKFKRLKGKLKYTIIDTQHRNLFVNSLFPHLKYPLRQQKFQSRVEAL
jgi:hypothetical protein